MDEKNSTVNRIVGKCKSFLEKNLPSSDKNQINNTDENVLIRSEVADKVKLFLKKCPIICLAIAAVISLILAIPFEITTYRVYTGWSEMWFFKTEFMLFLFILFVIAALCFIIGVTVGIIYLVNRNCELIITENDVKGKTLLGKEVVLPLHMVSAYSTRKFLSVISIATASGITKFALIKNYREIGNVLAQKINERQKNTAVSAPVTPAPVVQPADEAEQIKKFKDLLDSGIITQEEFDAKKKQLLGL